MVNMLIEKISRSGISAYDINLETQAGREHTCQ